MEQVGALGRSKWSDDLEELENDTNVPKKDTVAVLSYLDRARGKSEKSVHWGDQVSPLDFVFPVESMSGQSIGNELQCY